MARFKDVTNNADQIVLFSNYLGERIDNGHEIRLLDKIMDSMNWSPLINSYKDRGCPAYDPRRMAKVLIYSYSRKVFSSREIANNLLYDLRYMWLGNGITPDFHTICRFRKEKYEYLKMLFVESVLLSARAGLVLLNSVSVDGSKIEASASKRSVCNSKDISKELKEIEDLLAEADNVDNSEDSTASKEETDEKVKKKQELESRKTKLNKLSSELKEINCSSIVSSDPDSRVMKLNNGTLRPCYNMQAAVDVGNRIIVGMDIVQSANDAGQLRGMITQIRDNIGCSSDLILADKGYSDERTFEWLSEDGQDALVAIKEHPKNTNRNNLFNPCCFLKDDLEDFYVCPAGRRLAFKNKYRCGSGEYFSYAATGCGSCSFRNECVGDKKGSRRLSVSVHYKIRNKIKERLRSKEGKELFSKRGQSVETVFGQIKRNFGFQRYLTWGIKGAIAETSILCMAHNIHKVVKQIKAIKQTNSEDTGGNIGIKYLFLDLFAYITDILDYYSIRRYSRNYKLKKLTWWLSF